MLMRFDPFRDLDRLTQNLWGGDGNRLSAMPLDAYRVGDTFRLDLDVPGVDPSTVELTVEKNVLTIRAERPHQWADGAEVIVHERPEGSFTRQLFLGEALDPDGISANCENGVLTVTIPMAERAKARRVEVNGSGGQRTAINATAQASDSTA